MAVEHLARAYSANLQRTLERETRRPVSLGAVHSSLERLEAKRPVVVGGWRADRRTRRPQAPIFALTRRAGTALRDAAPSVNGWRELGSTVTK